MTTIAYTSGVMAADSMLDAGSMKIPASKIHIVNERFVLGGAGIVAKILDRDAKKAYRFDGGRWIPLTRAYHAIGSGRDYAIGAMYAGMCASDAVRAAVVHDVYSGGEVSTIRCFEVEAVGDLACA